MLKKISPQGKLKVLRVVALASDAGRYGGPYDTSLAQSRLVAESGHHVVLFAGLLQNDSVARLGQPRLKLVFVRVRPLLPRSGFWLLGSFRAFGQLWQQIRVADVVHLSLARELLPQAALALAILLKTPAIVQPHGMLTARTSACHRVFDLLARRLFARASAVIALTSTEAAQLRRWAGNKSPVVFEIGNPIINTQDSFTPIAPLERVREALYIGRLQARKRIVDVVEAAKHSQRQGWDHPYVLIGPDQGELGLITRAQLALPTLRYEGHLPAREIPNRLSRSRVFVLLSEDEPWGNMLVLALSMGIPVVISRSAALASHVEVFSAGFVVPDQSPERVSEHVYRLMNEEDLYLRCVEGARALTKALLDDGKVLAALRLAYRDVIERTRNSWDV